MSAIRISVPGRAPMLDHLGPSHGERHDWYRIRVEAIRYVEWGKPVRPKPSEIER